MSYDITTTVGQIRLLIGDTNEADEVFTDAEITYFYTTAGSVYGAAAMAARAWAAKYATNADAEKIGDYSYSLKAYEKMISLADKLEAVENLTPVLEISEMDLSGGSAITAEED